MNTITELEKEIEALEQNKKDIDDKIVSIKKKIVVLKNSERFLNIKTNEANKELFSYYLMENRSLSEIGVLIPTELYFIDDIKVFELIMEEFKNSEAMQIECRKRHNDLSAAINNYHQFLLTLKEIR